MVRITRARRAELLRAAKRLRQHGQVQGWPIARVAERIHAELPEVSLLEAFRLANGWTRQQALDGIAQLYTAQRLRPPPIGEPMLTRWEHRQVHPSAEYLGALCGLYRARADQLGFGAGAGGQGSAAVAESWYAPAATVTTAPRGLFEGVPGLDRPTGFQRLLAGYFQVRADEGLPVLRESVELTLEAQGPHGQGMHELLDQVVECYALVYGTVDPGALFVEVSRCRRLVTGLLAGPQTEVARAHLRQVAGWLSALLGNLSFHTSDYAQARVHLAAAHELGVSGGSEGLVAWSRGAQSMVAWFAGEYAAAAEFARDGVAHARTPLVRAQLLSWGRLRALAGMGQRTEALRVLGEAADALAADPKGSAAGRFGFDLREFELHAAEACLALGELDRAQAHAGASMELRVAGTPGWGDAMLVRALADARGREPAQAAERATRVLDAIPPVRLRETNRQRLQRLDHLLAGVDQAAVTTFREQLRALPVPPPAGQTTR